MNLESIRAYCLQKPGKVVEDFPFGEEVLVFRVSGKIFLLAPLKSVPPAINLKCDPALAVELRDRYDAVKPGYHMNKRHWNTVTLDGSIPSAEVRQMIDHSYALVAVSVPVARTPKKKPGGPRRAAGGSHRR